MDSTTLPQLINFCRRDIVSAQIFEEVMTAYEEYFDIGTKYLLDNRGTVLKCLELNADQSEPFDTKGNVYAVAYAIKHTQRINILMNIFTAYQSQVGTLLLSLKKYQEILLPILKQMADTTQEKENIKVSATVPPTMPAVCPDIKCLEDITPDNMKLLEKWVQENPFNDKIFKLGAGGCSYQGLSDKVYLTGSRVLLCLYNCINTSDRIPVRNIQTYGTNIFYLCSKKNKQTRIGDVCITKTTHTSIDDLLLDFDLPCGRIAAINNVYCVSAQCLLSLVTNSPVIIPAYINSDDFFMRKVPTNMKNQAIKSYKQLQYRMHKYINRGYTFKFVDTDLIMDFIKNYHMYVAYNNK